MHVDAEGEDEVLASVIRLAAKPSKRGAEKEVLEIQLHTHSSTQNS